MKQLLTILLFIITALAGSAQVNESDTVKFQLKATLTGNYQKGNVDVLTLRSRADISYKPANNWVIKSQNVFLFQSFYNRKADNDVFSRNYIYYKPSQPLYPFGITYLSANYRRKIDTRYFTGAGVTYQLLKKPNNTIKIAASLVYEHTLFNGRTYNDAVYNGRNTVNLWRGTLFTGGWFRLLQNHLRIYYDAYWQPALSNKHNYRTQYDIGIDLPVWKGFSASALYTFTHENLVIKEIKPEDRILTFGISWNIKQP